MSWTEHRVPPTLTLPLTGGGDRHFFTVGEGVTRG